MAKRKPKEEIKDKGGRPTKLTSELIEKAKLYLPTCKANPIFSDKGTLLYVDVELPAVVSLAIFLGIDKATVYRWCQDDTDDLAIQFCDIVKEVESAQEKMLVNKGLGGLFQPKTTGMLLAKHGYSEKIETDITSDGKKLDAGITNIINKIYGGNGKLSDDGEESE